MKSENWLNAISPILMATMIALLPTGSHATTAASVSGQQTAEAFDRTELDVPFVPTPQNVVDKMLELADVKKNDIVYDLGCGDGRIVVTAAKKYGARGIGVDLDPQRVQESQQNVKTQNVGKLVKIRRGDALKTDVSEATIVTLYLLPEVNLKLRSRLQSLKPGTRIISHDFDMGDWKPLKTVRLKDDLGREHSIYMWKVGQGH